jgi:hypothetical protein
LNIKESTGVALACITLMGIGYTAALRGGYVIDEAMAQQIAQNAIIPEERARLEFMRQMKFDRLRLLNAKDELSADEELEAEILRDEIRRITDRLEQLR